MRTRLIAALALVAALTVPNASRGAAVPASWPPSTLANGSFETGSGSSPTSWTSATGGLLGGATVRWETGVARTGTRSVSIERGGGSWTSATVPSGPAGAYRAFSAWLRTPRPGNGNDALTVSVNWLNNLGLDAGRKETGNLRTACNAYYFSWAGDWCFVYVVTAVPSSAVSARFKVATQSGNVSRWYIDNATFGPTTALAASVGSQLHPALPSGQGTVTVDASAPIRDIPTTSFGDATLWHTGAMPANGDNPVVQAAIRDHSRPGVLRYGGGDQSTELDWEHPTLSFSGETSDIDEFMRYARASGATEVIYTLNMVGTANAFTVRYTGNATTALLSLDHDSLYVALAGQTDGTSDLNVDFNTQRTAGQVVAAIDTTPGYDAALSHPDRGRDPVLEELVGASGVNVKATTATVKVNLANLRKAERLVDYLNNPASTVIGPSGVTRDQALAARGLPSGPYNVRFFEVGNETYFSGRSTPLNPVAYAQEAARFARALRAVYPAFPIQVGAPIVSFQHDHVDECCGPVGFTGPDYVFNIAIAQHAGTDIDFLIEHTYGGLFRTTWAGALSPPQHLQRIRNIRMLQEQFAAFSPDHRENIPVFVTEFNTLGAQFLSTSGLTNQNYQLGNGLYTADMLGVMLEQGVTLTTHHVQLDFPFASSVVIDNGTRVAIQASGYALELFNRHFGTRLLTTTYRSPTYNIPSTDRPEEPPGGSGNAYPYQTAYSSLSADGTKLYVMLINKSGSDPNNLAGGYGGQSIATTVTLNGFVPAPAASVWRLTGDSLSAHNLPLPAGGQGSGFNATAIRIDQSTISNASANFTYTTPPYSATVLELTRS